MAEDLQLPHIDWPTDDAGAERHVTLLAALAVTHEQAGLLLASCVDQPPPDFGVPIVNVRGRLVGPEGLPAVGPANGSTGVSTGGLAAMRARTWLRFDVHSASAMSSCSPSHALTLRIRR